MDSPLTTDYQLQRDFLLCRFRSIQFIPGTMNDEHFVCGEKVRHASKLPLMEKFIPEKMLFAGRVVNPRGAIRGPI